MQQMNLTIIKRKEIHGSKLHNVIIVAMLTLFNVFYINGKSVKNKELIYILEWTPTNAEPFNFLEQGQNAFVTRNCTFQNCFLTSNHNFFSNVLDFDALLFNAPHIHEGMHLPPNRSNVQNYIMTAMEPAAYYPLPKMFDNYFNLTWTYKLDSDIPFPYIVIKNQHGEVIGPKVDMHWMAIKEMNETSDYVKNKLHNKSIAVAWIASNCNSLIRLHFAQKLQKELANYGHRLDIFGKCGNHHCPKSDRMDECYALIESDYYFYLAFENSFGVDYVSEKLLHALEHYTVPVVLGGANYSRFMPQGIYLNAWSLGIELLARNINHYINVRSNYYKFFKWHGHYTFHYTGEDNFHREVCGLCELLNNKTKTNQSFVFSDIVQWWNEAQVITITASTNPMVSYGIILEDEDDDTLKGLLLNLLKFFFG